MSRKINVDPVLRFLEKNHDFCDTKKEIKVLCIERSAIITELIRASHLLCFRYYEKSFWPLYSGVLRPGYLAKTIFFHKIFIIATIYTKYGVKV